LVEDSHFVAGLGVF